MVPVAEESDAVDLFGPPVAVPVGCAFLHLSGWSGLPEGATVDPLGVECFADPQHPTPLPATGDSVALHTLSSQRWTPEEARAWVLRQLADYWVPFEDIDDDYGNYTDLLSAAEARMSDAVPWTEATLTVSGAELDAQLLLVEGDLWGAVAVREDLVVCVVADQVDRAGLALRWATEEEQARLAAQAAAR